MRERFYGSEEGESKEDDGNEVEDGYPDEASAEHPVKIGDTDSTTQGNQEEPNGLMEATNKESSSDKDLINLMKH